MKIAALSAVGSGSGDDQQEVFCMTAPRTSSSHFILEAEVDIT